MAALKRKRPFPWGDRSTQMTAADLDGDGRDELVVSQGARLRALDRDLKERFYESPGGVK